MSSGGLEVGVAVSYPHEN